MAEELGSVDISQSSNVGSLPYDAAVKLTPRAIAMVQSLRAKEGLTAEQGLRVGVVGGGCSGFQYSMKFDVEQQGDAVCTFDDVKVLVDDASLPYLEGTTLDYVEGLHGAGFRFDNPKATRSCGCGSSFSA